jgi:hypothetical protein
MLLSGTLKSFNAYVSKFENKNVFYLTFDVNIEKSIITDLEKKELQPKYCNFAVSLKKIGGGAEIVSYFLNRDCFFEINNNCEGFGNNKFYTITQLLTERQFYEKYYVEIDRKSGETGIHLMFFC